MGGVRSNDEQLPKLGGDEYSKATLANKGKY
jgi:hypothetical protein